MRFRLTAASTTAVVALALIAAPATADDGPDLVAQAQVHFDDAETAYAAMNAAYQSGNFAGVAPLAAKITTADDAIEALLAEVRDDMDAAQDAIDEAQDDIDAAQAMILAYAAAVAEVDRLQEVVDGLWARENSLDTNIGIMAWQLALMSPTMVIVPGYCYMEDVTTIVCIEDVVAPNPDYAPLAAALDQARTELAEIQTERPKKESDLESAKELRDGLSTGQSELTTATSRLASMQSWLADATEKFEAIDDLHDDVHWWDLEGTWRLQDIADVKAFYDTASWGVGTPGKAKAGDTVEVDFTITNTANWELFDAAVTVTSPKGVTAVCDIAEGTVAAGAAVSCTAEYLVTDADAQAGTVTFTVELTGTLPLGPGNPRATAVSGTTVTVTRTVTFDVESAEVVDTTAEEPDTSTPDTSTPDETVVDDEVAAAPSEPVETTTEDSDAESTAVTTGAVLAESGPRDIQLGLAVALMLMGTALVVGRRRLESIASA